MTVLTEASAKALFETGDKPTQQDFEDLFDTLSVRPGPVFNVSAFGAKGDGTTDDSAAILSAVSARQAMRQGTVYFPEGTYVLSTAVTLVSGDTLEGTKGAVIKTTNSNAAIGTDFNEAAQTALDANASAGTDRFALPSGEGANFSKGSYIGLESLEVAFDQNGTNKGRAREVRQVVGVSSDTIIVEGKLLYDYTTANSATFENFSSGAFTDITIRNLGFTTDDPTTNQVRLIKFDKVIRGRLENLHFFDAGGGIQVKESQSIVARDIQVDRLPSFSDSFGYGIWLGGACSDIYINNLEGRDTRHLFTTLSNQVSGSAGGSIFRGGPRNVMVADSRGYSGTSAALAPFDTHEFGDGIVFRNCIVDGTDAAAGIQVRAHNVHLIDCDVKGGFRHVDVRDGVKGFRITGGKFTRQTSPFQPCINLNGAIEAPIIDGLHISDAVGDAIDIGPAGAVIRNCYIRNITEAFIKDASTTAAGTPSIIHNNTFHRVSAGNAKVALESFGTEGHSVVGNSFIGFTSAFEMFSGVTADGAWSGNTLDGQPLNGGVFSIPGASVSLDGGSMDGSTINNDGLSVSANVTLPVAVPGRRFSFHNVAAQGFGIVPTGGNRIITIVSGTLASGAAMALPNAGFVELKASKQGDWRVIVDASAQIPTSVATGLAATDFSTTAAVVLDSLVSVNHGLGAVPRLVQGFIKCASDSDGHVAGDYITLSSPGGENTDQGADIHVNDTYVKITTGANFYVKNPSTFNADAITAANWEYVVRLWS